ncbi:MAG: patatin-like phospholipase family protein [Rikenellaceae bacterium]
MLITLKRVLSQIGRVFLLFVVFFVLSLSATAQSVGVVLSGGGAKGLYHIGILKALEENNIPIDYVAGTSMGAIVAGMYAAGYSPDDILAIFRSGDVEVWLSGKMEDKYKFYYKQPPTNGSMISLNVNFRKFLERRRTGDKKTSSSEKMSASDGEITGFKSAIPSTQLDMAMLNYFAGATAASHHNFDSLFVPFRCVSVDILDRKQFLWKEGDLGMAVRSSMSIPLVFEPLMVHGKMMVDGGVLNNFPWQDMKDDFNPDIMIGGVCSNNSVNPSTISGQIELLTISKTDYNIPDSLGLVVRRDVDVGMLEYSKVDYVVELGYNDALKMMPQIKQRITRRESTTEIAMRRLKFMEKCPTLVVDSLDVVGLNAVQKKFVEGQLSYNEGETISFEEFKREYYKIIEGGVIKTGFPTADYNPITGRYSVDVHMRANSTLKALAGVNISSANINVGYLGLEYAQIGRTSSYHSLTGYFGNFYSSVSYDTRFNFFDRKNPYYIKGGFSYQFYDYGRGNNQRYSFSHRAFDYSRMNSYYLYGTLGAAVGQVSRIELRASAGRDSYRYDIVNSLIETEVLSPNESTYDYVSSNLSLSRNSLNYKVYPTRGLQQTISLIGTLAKDYYTPAVLAVGDVEPSEVLQNNWAGVSYSRDYYYRLFNNITIGYALDGIYTTIPDLSSEYATALISPGFYPTEHSNTLFIPQYHNSSYVAAGIKPIIEWNDNLYLKSEIYGYFSNFHDIDNSELLFIVSSSLVYQSPIGPVSFNYSFYENDSMAQNFFTFNIGFIIFKQRGVKFF